MLEKPRVFQECGYPAHTTLGLDLTALIEFEGSAMESNVLPAGDLGQDTDHSDMENSYMSATETDMEMDT